MTKRQELQQKWEAYRPAKAAVAWSFAGGVAVTLVVGFMGAGWVTGGTAQEQKEAAVEDARAELAAIICVDRFMQGATASVDLAALKQTDSWKQDDVVEDGGWVTLPGADEPVARAGELCADQLVDMEIPAPEPADQAAAIEPDAT